MRARPHRLTKSPAIPASELASQRYRVGRYGAVLTQGPLATDHEPREAKTRPYATAPAGPSSGSTADEPPAAAWQRPTWPGHGLTGPPTVLEGRFGFLQAFPAVLRVTTRTGEELEARVEVNRGGPGNPLSDEELARKFHDNAVRSLPGGARGRARGPNARPS